MSIILAEIADQYSTDDLFAKLGITWSPSVYQQSKSNAKSKTITSLTSSDLIIESQRNNTLTSIAGVMRRKGLGVEAIEAALMATNELQVYPPLPDVEVRQIAASIMRYPSTSDSTEIIQSMNDVGNAQRFEAMHQGQLYFVHGWNIWLFWQDSRWIKDQYGVLVQDLAKVTVKSIFEEAASQSSIDIMKLLSKHAQTSHGLPRIKAMLEIASLDPRLCVTVQKLDANPMLLGVVNGVINLETGKLEPNKQLKLITCYSNVIYDKKAKCPIFIEFLNKIFMGDQAKIAFIKRIVGYCLTGKTDEQVYFFFFGFGANGKTTLLRVIELLLGSSLAKQTPAETLMANLQGNKQSNDLARLQSVRVVIANEVEDGSRLAESLVKQITGGDTVTARFLFKEFFEFRPEFKLIIAGNHKPIIKSSDNGIWRRTVLVDFPVSIPKAKQDPNLSKKLEAELPGILNWAIAGCLEWQKIGLAIPVSVTNDIAEYKEEMDWLGQWMSDCCAMGTSHTENATKLYLSYKAWSECNGMHPSTATAFGRRLLERGFTKNRRTGGYWYTGLSISIPTNV
jgi:putative DNA primase/helicase